jgi:hypothetical protein
VKKLVENCGAFVVRVVAKRAPVTGGSNVLCFIGVIQ